MQPGNLRCDAAECDYVTEEKVPASELAAWLNRPCPQCGAPLLTEEQLELVNMLRSLCETFSEAVGPVAETDQRLIITIKEEKK